MERAGAACLSEKYSIITFYELIIWYVHIEQIIEPMNAMPCNRIVRPNQSTRKLRTICLWIVDPNLFKTRKKRLMLVLIREPNDKETKAINLDSSLHYLLSYLLRVFFSSLNSLTIHDPNTTRL